MSIRITSEHEEHIVAYEVHLALCQRIAAAILRQRDNPFANEAGRFCGGLRNIVC